MTMFEHLPRFLRGSSADEIGTEPLDARVDEANNRLADVMLPVSYTHLTLPTT